MTDSTQLFFGRTLSISVNSGNAADLTTSELAWLKSHSKIRIGVDPSYAPYSFRDDGGRYRGIAMEFVDYLSDQLGSRWKLCPT